MVLIALRVLLLVSLLALIYAALAAWQRWATVRALRAEHARGAAPALTCEDYVAKGLADYNRSWARKSLIGIFVVPLLAAAGLMWLANYG